MTTEEDYHIWWSVRRRFGTYPHASVEYDAVWSDKRDADVMFYAQQFKLADTLRVDQAGGGVLVRLPALICHNADPPEIFG